MKRQRHDYPWRLRGLRKLKRYLRTLQGTIDSTVELWRP